MLLKQTIQKYKAIIYNQWFFSSDLKVAKECINMFS